VSTTGLQVDRTGADLVVTWTSPGDPELYVSASPDGHDGRRVELVGPGEARVVDAAATQRHYVHAVADGHTAVATERLVPLDGTMNFRDLGGYVGADGRSVRWGRVYRSDALAQLSDSDHVTLATLGLATILDVRGPRETEAQPPRLPVDGSIAWVEAPIAAEVEGSPSIDSQIRRREISSYGVEDMVGLYVTLVCEAASSVGTVFDALTATDQPAVFHCAAGKDRTGMIAAMLLEVLGVGEDDVLDDYELTNRYRTGARLAALREELEPLGIDLDPFMDFFRPNRLTMVGALATLRTEYGSIEAFLVGPAGARPDTVERLRGRLLA
jgi:protein-tyrosine phosphatase